MKILILTNHFLPRLGGVEFVTHNLADELSLRGHNVTVLAPSIPDQLSLLRTNYRIVRCTIPPLLPIQWGKAYWLAKEYLRERYDLIHAQMLYHAGYEAIWFKRFKRVPVIVTPHGADIHTYKPLKYGLLLNAKYRRYICRVLRHADAITFSNKATFSALQELGYENERCYFLPNGTRRSRFNLNLRDKYRKELQLPASKPIFVAVSRNSQIKGLPIILKALSILRESEKNIHAVIAGNGVDQLADLISVLDLKDHVSLFPNLPLEYDLNGVPISPSSLVTKLLVACDVYVAPAYSGTFDLSCVDAFAAGLPTIVSNGIGIEDYVKQNDAGIVVPNGNIVAFAHAMKTLIVNSDRRMKMQQNALNASVILDWSCLAERCEKIYEDVLERYWSETNRKTADASGQLTGCQA